VAAPIKPQANSLGRSVTGLAREPWRLAAVLLLAFLFAAEVYRAATQSIAHDEGVIFEWFLVGPWSRLFGFEHGNHHPLNDLLCRISIGAFGLSELSYRLPALLGGLLYFYSVFRLATFLFGRRFLFFLAVAVLTLNPFVLDYLCYSRGYSLALGLFLFALDWLVRYLAVPDAGRGQIRVLLGAGVALGLSAGSNPVMIFPAGGLAAALFAILAADAWIGKPQPVAEPEEKSKKAKKARRRKPRGETVRPRAMGQALLYFAMPALVVGGFLLSLPAQLVELGEYLGPPSLASVVEPLARYSLFHSSANFSGLALGLGRDGWVHLAALAVPACLLAAVAAAAEVAALWLRRRDFDALEAIDRFVLLAGLLLPVTLALVVISHYGFDQPYPEMRTALYWIPLLSLAALALVRKFRQRRGAMKLCAMALECVLALGAIQFATQFNTRYFAEWPYCAAGRDMMRAVVADHARAAAGHVTIGATWKLEPVINFYRAAWRLDWIEPVTRESPAGRFDYYMLLPEDAGVVEQLGLRRLARDRLSGAVLAAQP